MGTELPTIVSLARIVLVVSRLRSLWLWNGNGFVFSEIVQIDREPSVVAPGASLPLAALARSHGRAKQAVQRCHCLIHRIRNLRPALLEPPSNGYARYLQRQSRKQSRRKFAFAALSRASGVRL